MDARLEIAWRQIEFAREYSTALLEGIEDGEWFATPDSSPTHLAWQVGHLAMAQYGLCLFRIRGRRTEDSELMTSRFRKQFSRGSLPVADAAAHPSPDEIRGVFDRVYERVQLELPATDPSALDEPVDAPYAGYATKLGALLFCSHHEMIHAGQIGLLRRLLGREPVR
ncbi:MAG: DinB family protein [Pirellulaceae bacterium]|jgi:hypothetical protein|nr:DinB family protein [Pirellulaceae bacterium]MDP7016811.1 DinB family protein [Pirellulaceae bacterium]